MRIKGAEDLPARHIIFRSKDERSFHALSISTDGRQQILRVTDGTNPKPLLDIKSRRPDQRSVRNYLLCNEQYLTQFLDLTRQNHQEPGIDFHLSIAFRTFHANLCKGFPVSFLYPTIGINNPALAKPNNLSAQPVICTKSSRKDRDITIPNLVNFFDNNAHIRFCDNDYRPTALLSEKEVHDIIIELQPASKLQNSEKNTSEPSANCHEPVMTNYDGGARPRTESKPKAQQT